jgi:hypothetical protein
MTGGYKPRLHDNIVTWKKGDKWITGYIYDKYSGTKESTSYVGIGGSQYSSGYADSVTIEINTDYYIVNEVGTKKTHHVECKHVQLYNKDVHINGDSEKKLPEKKVLSTEEALG